MNAKFSDLLGLVLVSITGSVGHDEMIFKTQCGRTFRMLHWQDCCESVRVEDITGDLADLIGHPILIAEESSSDEVPNNAEPPQYQDDLFLWTFYKLATIKGYVDIRWYGESNGYYGVGVDFEEVVPL